MPVKVCENARIWACKIVKGDVYRGYTPSKREYFYGFKLNALMDSRSRHDIDSLANISFYGVKNKEAIVIKHTGTI